MGRPSFEIKLFCDHSIRKLHKRFFELDNFVLVLLKIFWLKTKAFYDFTRFSAVEIAKPQSSIQKSHKNVHKCVLRSSALLILKVNGELQDPTEKTTKKKIPNTEKIKSPMFCWYSFPIKYSVVVFALSSLASHKIINQNNENVEEEVECTFVRQQKSCCELFLYAAAAASVCDDPFVQKRSKLCEKNVKRFFSAATRHPLAARAKLCAKKPACWYKKQMTECCLPSIVYYSSD